MASFTCPRCGMTSHNPSDVAEGYCGNCHDWTGTPRPRTARTSVGGGDASTDRRRPLQSAAGDSGVQGDLFKMLDRPGSVVYQLGHRRQVDTLFPAARYL
jgi:hypothetical protein